MITSESILGTRLDIIHPCSMQSGQYNQYPATLSPSTYKWWGEEKKRFGKRKGGKKRRWEEKLEQRQIDWPATGEGKKHCRKAGSNGILLQKRKG